MHLPLQCQSEIRRQIREAFSINYKQGITKEKIVRIVEQKAHVARQYTAQDGTQKTFHSMGFILSDGIDEFYAEMTGEMARDCQPYDANLLHVMQGYIKQRSFEDKNGVKRYENQIYITKLI